MAKKIMNGKEKRDRNMAIRIIPKTENITLNGRIIKNIPAFARRIISFRATNTMRKTNIKMNNSIISSPLFLNLTNKVCSGYFLFKI